MQFDFDGLLILNIIMFRLKLIALLFLITSCSGNIDKCVENEMKKFYADKKSGRHVKDIVYKSDGSIHKKVKRSAEDHEKLMKNDCLKKHFKKN